MAANPLTARAATASVAYTRGNGATRVLTIESAPSALWTRRTHMRRAILGALWITSAVISCSSSSDDNGNGGAGAGVGGQLIFMGGSGDGGPLSTPGLGMGCANSSVATEAAPLDIYVMFDRSCSMSCPPAQGGPGLCCIGGPGPPTG